MNNHTGHNSNNNTNNENSNKTAMDTTKLMVDYVISNIHSLHVSLTH